MGSVKNVEAPCTTEASIKPLDVPSRLLTPELETNQTNTSDLVDSPPRPSTPVTLPTSVHVSFAPNSVELTVGALRLLEIIIDFMQVQKTMQLQVVGYGKSNEPESVGLKRAFAVIDYMFSKGVPRERFWASGQRSSIP